MSKSTLDSTHQAYILVVDDDPNVRLLLAREIGDRGYEVVAAMDGAQAMAEMDRGDFDVVLTDIRMPGMDGLGLTEWIKRTRPDTEVIVMTAFASLEIAATAVCRDQRRPRYDPQCKKFQLQDGDRFRRALGDSNLRSQ